MKIFHCDHCDQLVFFENTICVNCGRSLAYLPDVAEIASFDPGAGSKFSPAAGLGRSYRLCSNYPQYQICNWAVPTTDPNPLCRSCRLTRIIPD
jgi:hypothetical protein